VLHPKRYSYSKQWQFEEENIKRLLNGMKMNIANLQASVKKVKEWKSLMKAPVPMHTFHFEKDRCVFCATAYNQPFKVYSKHCSSVI
jgi:hypothetical protein